MFNLLYCKVFVRGVKRFAHNIPNTNKVASVWLKYMRMFQLLLSIFEVGRIKRHKNASKKLAFSNRKDRGITVLRLSLPPAACGKTPGVSGGQGTGSW